MLLLSAMVTKQKRPRKTSGSRRFNPPHVSASLPVARNPLSRGSAERLGVKAPSETAGVTARSAGGHAGEKPVGVGGAGLWTTPTDSIGRAPVSLEKSAFPDILYSFGPYDGLNRVSPRSRRLRTPHMIGDQPRKPAPQTPRQVVAHPLDHHQFGSRDRRRGRTPAADVAHPVVGAVDDERGRCDRSESFGPVARREDRDGLAHDAGRIVRAVEGEPRALADFALVDGEAGRADHAKRRDRPLDHFVARARRRSREHAHRFRRRLSDGDAAGGRHDRGQRADAVGMLEGNRLSDKAAHRGADEMGAFESEGIEESDRVRRHVGQVVRRRRRVSRQRGFEVGRGRIRIVRREAGVAVVEADGAQTAGDELGAEAFVPAEHLCADAHDEQDGRCVVEPEGFVGHLNPRRTDVGCHLLGHDGSLLSRVREATSDAEVVLAGSSRLQVARSERDESPLPRWFPEATIPASLQGASMSKRGDRIKKLEKERKKRRVEEELLVLGRDLIAGAPPEAQAPLSVYREMEAQGDLKAATDYQREIARTFLETLAPNQAKDDPAARSRFWIDFIESHAEAEKRTEAALALADCRDAYIEQVAAELWARVPPDIEADVKEWLEAVSEKEGSDDDGRLQRRAIDEFGAAFLDAIGALPFTTEDKDEFWRWERSPNELPIPEGQDPDPMSRYGLQRRLIDDPEPPALVRAAGLAQEHAATALFKSLPALEQEAFDELMTIDEEADEMNEGATLAVLAHEQRQRGWEIPSEDPMDAPDESDPLSD